MKAFWYFVIIVLLINSSCSKDPTSTEQPTILVKREMVLFASDRNGGNMNIWMMEKDGSHPRQLTFYPEGDYFPADISPDGKTLLFYRWDHYTLVSRIFVMPTTGPQPDPDQFLISYLCRPGNFFPDGQRFIYDQHTIVSDTNSHDAVYIFDLRDSSSTLVTPLGNSLEYAAFYSQVSPDGNKISFVQFYFGQFGLSGSQLYLMNFDGSNKQALTPGEQGRYVFKNKFSPDGRKIFYTLGSPIFSVNINTGEDSLVVNNNNSSYNPYPDTLGEKIYFRSGGGANPDQNSEIAAVNIDGTKLTKLTNNQFREDMPVVGVIEFYE